MHIAVLIAVVPDTTTKISFTDNHSRLNTERVQWVLNPLDEFALTRALELREQHGGKVTVINVGLSDAEPLIRKAFAMGADEGLRIDAAPADALFVATQIASYAKELNCDFFFAGRQTTDYEGCQVGTMVAELLGIPSVTGVPKFDFDGKLAVMEREIEGGKEVVEVLPPFVATIQEGVTEPRIPTMRGIMDARKKPLKVVPPASAEPCTAFGNYELPPPKGTCKMISADNPSELIELLHKEARVI